MSRSLATLALAAAALLPPPGAAIEWGPPERLTANPVEDRTTSGSLFVFETASAVWMQRQAGSGWRLMASDLGPSGQWSPPAPVEVGTHADFQPRLAGDAAGNRHLVWQRGSSTAGEIFYATGPHGGAWSVEPVTANATEDVTPDVADLVAGDGLVHVVWAGFDPISSAGKIFHAERSGTGWQIERLAASELGPFWTGAAPRVAVSPGGVVHVVYRGGDFGLYRTHYARRSGGVWSYQLLVSGNGNDFTMDVAARSATSVLVAMSGNDGFGFPSRIYIRRSTDGGVTFGPPVLAASGFSAVLENVTDGLEDGVVVASEVSGNIYTENAIIARETAGWTAEYLPPMNQSTMSPCGGQLGVVPALPGPLSVLYGNRRGFAPDSAEIYFIATPLVGAVAGGGVRPPARLALRVAPNPMAATTAITIEEPFSVPLAGARAVIAAPNGRLVRDLSAELARAPAGRMRWDGRDEAGREVAAGAYLLRVEVGGRAASTRLVVLR